MIFVFSGENDGESSTSRRTLKGSARTSFGARIDWGEAPSSNQTPAAFGAGVQDLVRKGAGESLGKLVVASEDASFVHVFIEPALVHPAHHESVGRHLVRPGGRLAGVQVGVDGDDVPRRSFFE